MRRFVLCVGIVLGCASSAFAACDLVYLPDLSGVAGQPTATIGHTFTVPAPAAGAIENFYPFDLVSTKESDGGWTVTVNQRVHHPSRTDLRQRVWRRVSSVSLISIMGYVWPMQQTPYGWYVQTLTAGWQPYATAAPFIMYSTVPTERPLGQEPTWAYRIDGRTWEPFLDRALSMPLSPYQSWNVGIFAPYGLQTVGLQIQARICYA